MLRFPIVWSNLYGTWNTCLRVYPVFTFILDFSHGFLIPLTFIFSYISTFLYSIEDVCFSTRTPRRSCHATLLSLSLKLNVSMWLILGNEMWAREARVTSGLTSWENSMCFTTLFHVEDGGERGLLLAFKQHVAEPKSKPLWCHCSTTDKTENSLKKKKQP